MEFLTWIALASLTRLTPEENDGLKEYCGSPWLHASAKNPRKIRNYPDPEKTGMFLNAARRVPVSTGRDEDANHFPFTAEIFVNGEFKCSGVLISQRHVMTAASCVLNRKTLTSPKLNLTRIVGLEPFANVEVSFPSRFTRERDIVGYLRRFKSNYVLPHPQFHGFAPKFDMAIIELLENINRNDAHPICLANQKDSLNPRMTSVGFGRYGDHANTEDVMRSMELTLNITLTSNESGIILTQDSGRRICLGDDGGPLLKMNGTKAYLLGLASTFHEVKPIRFVVRPEERTFVNKFVDVRMELPWICALTGVCTETEDEDSKTVEDQTRAQYTVGYKFGSDYKIVYPEILAHEYHTKSGTKYGVHCPKGWTGTICRTKEWGTAKKKFL